MAFIEVRLAEGVFGRDERDEIAAALTDAVVQVSRSEALRELVWVRVVEPDVGTWHVGGRPFRSSHDLMASLRRAGEAYQATPGYPTTRKDLAAAAPAGAPMARMRSTPPSGREADP